MCLFLIKNKFQKKVYEWTSKTFLSKEKRGPSFGFFYYFAGDKKRLDRKQKKAPTYSHRLYCVNLFFHFSRLHFCWLAIYNFIDKFQPV